MQQAEQARFEAAIKIQAGEATAAAMREADEVVQAEEAAAMHEGGSGSGTAIS